MGLSASASASWQGAVCGWLYERAVASKSYAPVARRMGVLLRPGAAGPECLHRPDAALDALASGRIGADQVPAVVDLAELPDMVRGYEGIKMANVARYREAVARQREVLGI